MEIRAYAAMLARRWPALIAIPVIAFALIVYIEQRRETQYTAESRVSVSRLSEGTTSIDYEFDDYYDLLASDFILDDTVEVVRGNVFANAVAQRLATQNIVVDIGTVQEAIDASREHRILTISSVTGEQGLSVIIANVAATELRENFSNYLGQDGEPLPMTIRPVDVPVDAESDDLRVRLTYALVLIVAAGLGVLLALAFDYFDESLTAESAEAVTGLRVLGSVTEST